MLAKPKTMSYLPCLFYPRNHHGGLEKRQISYSSEDLSPQVELTHQNGNVTTSDPPKRPQDLGVSLPNGYSKSPRDHSQDGSLPSTPDIQPGSANEVSDDHYEDEILKNDTRQLIAVFLSDFFGLSEHKKCDGKKLSTMKRVVADVLEKHKYSFNGMVSKLSLDNRSDMTFISQVARSLFADGITNWGRIVSLVAFGVVVCGYLKERGTDNCVELVSEEISSYLLSDQKNWLLENNSWDGFVDFFQVPDPESTIRNTLMAFIGVAGVGATLAYLIR